MQANSIIYPRNEGTTYKRIETYITTIFSTQTSRADHSFCHRIDSVENNFARLLVHDR